VARLGTRETFKQSAQRFVSTALTVVLGNVNLTDGFCVAVIRQVIGAIESIGNVVTLQPIVVPGLDDRVAEQPHCPVVTAARDGTGTSMKRKIPYHRESESSNADFLATQPVSSWKFKLSKGGEWVRTGAADSDGSNRH
jgi:hypothetical protein